MPQILSDELDAERPRDVEAIGPDQGVIEEARRRQRRRRLRYVLAGSLLAIAIAAIVWSVGGSASGAGSASPSQVEGTNRAIDVSDAPAVGFNVRLVPTLTVARTGWCVVVEEHGVTGGSACGGPAQAANASVEGYGWSKVGSGFETSVMVTTPQVAAVLVNGRVRVAPSSVPGLPYGLRAVRVMTSVPRSGRFEPGPTLVALDAQGRRISGTPSPPPAQGVVRTWRAPARAPLGVCQLHEAGVPGLLARGGQVASSIGPFPRALVGEAFVACVDSEYRLQGVPIDAEILLNAVHPGGEPAALPDWKAVPRAPGFFSEGGLVARRAGGAWLLVRQGASQAVRMRLLRHMTATVDLHG